MNFLSKKSIFLVLLHLLLVTLWERVGLYLQGGIPWSVGIIPAGPERPEQGALAGPVPQLVFGIVESLPELRRSGAMGARQDRHGRGSCQSLLVLGAPCSCGAASSAQGSGIAGWESPPVPLCRALPVLRAVWLLHRDPPAAACPVKHFHHYPSWALLYVPFLPFLLFGD